MNYFDGTTTNKVYDAGYKQGQADAKSETQTQPGKPESWVMRVVERTDGVLERVHEMGVKG